MELKARDEMPKEYLWKITDMYESDNVWQKDYDSLEGVLKEFNKFARNVTCENVVELLRLRDRANHLTERIYVYANLKSHEDTANTFYQGLAEKADNAEARSSAAQAFIEPAITSLEYDKVINAVKDTEYTHYIEDLFRNAEHILSADKEKILALSYEMRQTASNVFGMLNNADLKFDDIEDKDGRKYPLTHGKYSSYLESSDRVLRKNAFKSCFGAYRKLSNTIAAAYSGSVKTDDFMAKVRNYDSTLSAFLAPHNIPEKVYRNLITSIESCLTLLHRYIKLRKKILGVDELHFYDIYTPLIKRSNAKIPYPEAKKTVIEALKPLGEEYTAKLAEAFKSGWVDIYENKGKRSGAYSWGAYGTHPFVSLNYDESLNNVFTLAHEMGHAMHSYYTWETQPYVYGDYTIFVAEVASTVNESLLMRHLLKVTTDKEERKYLLNYFLDQFRGTFFRQTMFAEFELIVHEKAQRGEPLNFDTLCEIYKKLNVKYYGEDIVHDEEITWEWARIPHFYNAFYVYQYATGYSAAVAISKKILEENGAADYIKFLKSGSSDYSIELLKIAGVDMSSPEPIKNAAEVFGSILDEIEELF